MVGRDSYAQLHWRILGAFFALFLVLTAGTGGYWLIGDGQYSVVDCLYMTVITISTIGFTEVVDLTDDPVGRLFTIFLALSGIGVLTYLLSNFTASIVEGDLNEAFRRRKMEKKIQNFVDHFIVCGTHGVGKYIIRELKATKRPFVVIDVNMAAIETVTESEIGPFLIGDATDNEIQLKAGIERARGLFAVTGDDNQNLVICLTAKQLNPKVRVIARCQEVKNVDKIKTAGADDVVSTASIGGLRMASAMIRPTVVSFLDVMLRAGGSLRIEEITVGQTHAGRPLDSVSLEKYPNLLVLAVRTDGEYLYNPPRSYILSAGDYLIVMTTPEDRNQLEQAIGVS